MQVLIDGGQGHPVFGSRQLHVEPGSPIGTHILIDAGGPQNIPGAIESNLPPEKVGEGFTVALEEELVQLTNLQRMQRPPHLRGNVLDSGFKFARVCQPMVFCEPGDQAGRMIRPDIHRGQCR